MRLRPFVPALLVCALSACPPPPPVPPPGPPDPPPQEELCVDAPPGPRSVRLLTRAEYDRTLRDLLGDTSNPAKARLPSENVLIGFENDGDNHRATPLLVEEYLRLSEDVAARALAERRTLLFICEPSAQCGENFVDTFTPRAFRRPITSTERTRFLELFNNANALYGFDKAIELVTQAILVSPQFLYRIDLGAPPVAGEDVVLASPYEMASRLSYFLWGSMPDDELLAAAASGALHDVTELEAQARRMLADPKAKEATGAFFRQWLGIDEIEGLVKDAPEYQAAMNESWQRTLDAFVQNVVWEGDGTLQELFTSPTIYVDSLTAPLYELAGVNHDGVEPREAPNRAGLITQPGLMALLANPNQSSPIRRGVFIREKLMCQPIPPPPADVVIEPPPANPNLTTRERFAAHTENEQCAGCHVMIDPIGFGLEAYDALGRFRTTENGLPIDSSGELAFTTDPNIEGPFNGALELAQKLSQSSQVKDCVLGQALTFAMGRVADATADKCTIDFVRSRLDETGSLREMLVAIAISDSFRTTVAP